jgi:hypothetical protein
MPTRNSVISPRAAIEYVQATHFQQHHCGICVVDVGCQTCLSLVAAVQACCPPANERKGACRER